jgi:hypothetical protein
MPSANLTAHIVRRYVAASVAALLALGGMFIACEPAGASFPTFVLLGLVPSQDDDPPQKGEQDGDKKSETKEQKKPAINKDVKNIKELELPTPVVNELMRGSRSHRDPVPELLIKKPLLARKPTPDETKRFGDLKKASGDPKTKEDLALIDDVVKYQVYSMTDPKWYQPNVEARRSALEEMRRNRDEIEKTLFDAKGGSNENFMAIYKRTAMKYLAELLDNNLWVRVNAMRLLGMVKDEETIRLFVGQIEDPKQHEGIKFLAIEGIESLGQKKLIANVQLESLAVNSLLNVLKKGDQVHPFTRQAAVRALGAIGRPTRVIGRNDADVAVALLKVLRDPNIRRMDRNDAVVALASLQIPPELDYNFQYVAYEIAQFVVDVGAAALQNPSTDDLHGYLYLADASYALAPREKVRKMPLVESAKKHAKAKSHADSAYIQLLGDQVNRLNVSGIKAYKPDAVMGAKAAAAALKVDDVVNRTKEIAGRLQNGDFAAELKSLNDLLKNKPPRSMQLTPDTEELGPPPALVGPAAPVAKEAEANGKDKGGEKAAANNSPGP